MRCIRKAKEEDFEAFYEIKSDSDNIYWCGYTDEPPKENIRKFWDKFVIHSQPSRTVFMIIRPRKLSYKDMFVDEVVGYIYNDYDYEKHECEISIAVNEKYSGQGLATKALNQMTEIVRIEKRGFEKLVSYIREDNARSKHLFKKCGYLQTDEYHMQYIENLDKEICMCKYTLGL